MGLKLVHIVAYFLVSWNYGGSALKTVPVENLRPNFVKSSRTRKDSSARGWSPASDEIVTYPFNLPQEFHFKVANAAVGIGTNAKTQEEVNSRKLKGDKNRANSRFDDVDRNKMQGIAPVEDVKRKKNPSQDASSKDAEMEQKENKESETKNQEEDKGQSSSYNNDDDREKSKEVQTMIDGDAGKGKGEGGPYDYSPNSPVIDFENKEVRTFRPSKQPSSSPSNQPSVSPSIKRPSPPHRKPSGAPTSQPSTAPSLSYRDASSQSPSLQQKSNAPTMDLEQATSSSTPTLNPFFTVEIAISTTLHPAAPESDNGDNRVATMRAITGRTAHPSQNPFSDDTISASDVTSGSSDGRRLLDAVVKTVTQLLETQVRAMVLGDLERRRIRRLLLEAKMKSFNVMYHPMHEGMEVTDVEEDWIRFRLPFEVREISAFNEGFALDHTGEGDGNNDNRWRMEVHTRQELLSVETISRKTRVAVYQGTQDGSLLQALQLSNGRIKAVSSPKPMPMADNEGMPEVWPEGALWDVPKSPFFHRLRILGIVTMILLVASILILCHLANRVERKKVFALPQEIKEKEGFLETWSKKVAERKRKGGQKEEKTRQAIPLRKLPPPPPPRPPPPPAEHVLVKLTHPAISVPCHAPTKPLEEANQPVPPPPLSTPTEISQKKIKSVRFIDPTSGSITKPHVPDVSSIPDEKVSLQRLEELRAESKKRRRQRHAASTTSGGGVPPPPPPLSTQNNTDQDEDDNGVACSGTTTIITPEGEETVVRKKRVWQYPDDADRILTDIQRLERIANKMNFRLRR